MSKEVCWVVDCGELDYLTTLDLQKKVSSLRQRNIIPDVLLLVEHSPVIVMGTSSRESMLRIPRRVLEQRGIPTYDVNISGGAQIHSPGKLVVYSIRSLDANKLDIHNNTMEDLMINFLRDYKIDARKSYTVNDEVHKRIPGVWVMHDRKEANLGTVATDMKNGVTQHGFSLNVNNSLEYSDFIDMGKKASISMKRLLNRPLHMPDIKARLSVLYGELLGYSIEKKMFMSFVDAINKASHVPEVKENSKILY